MSDISNTWYKSVSGSLRCKSCQVEEGALHLPHCAFTRREVKCGNPNCVYYRWSDEPCPKCGYDPRTASEKLENLRKEANKLYSGAKSSASPRFDLIPHEALVRLAQRYEKGMKRYGKNNWREGLNDREYILERLAHAVGHLYALMDQVEGRLPWSDEDHAAALIWAGAFACEATKVLQEEEKAAQEIKATPDDDVPF